MKRRNLLTLVVAAMLLHCAPAALACTACYGQSDSALAQGMNNGIFVLLGFIGLVLVGVSAFFVFILRRAARLHAQSQTVPNAN
jgi:heme/copper-type cytochrome/quinol oxidase subunit 2